MLEINDIHKHYGNNKVLQQVTLSIPPNTCFGLIGPNGAGKSTLMKIIATIIQADDGRISLNEQPLSHDAKTKIGYVPQEICLEPKLSALENLLFFGRLFRLKGIDLKLRAKEVLSDIGLKDKSHQKVATFSGGMKRRLNIGCALMNRPQLILMDEPTVGVDPQSRRYIFKMIQNLKKSGHTIIYASHYIEEIEHICDEVAFIDHGKIIEHGTLNDLLDKHSNLVIIVEGDQCLPPNIEQYGHVNQQENKFVITSQDPLLAMESILAFCRQNNRPLTHIALDRLKLEDIFFTLTGSKLRDS